MIKKDLEYNSKIVQENGNKLTNDIINLLEGYDLKAIGFAQLKMIDLIRKIMPNKEHMSQYLNMIINI